MSNGDKEYKEKMEAKMKKWDDQIAALEADAEKAKADLKSDYHRKVAELRERKEELKKRYEEMKDSGDDAWDMLNKEFQKGFEEIKESFKEDDEETKN